MEDRFLRIAYLFEPAVFFALHEDAGIDAGHPFAVRRETPGPLFDLTNERSTTMTLVTPPRFRRTMLAATAMAVAAITATSLGGEANIVPYYYFEEWTAATGEYATLDFTGFEDFEVLSDQYSDVGVTFPSGFDVVWNSPTYFLNDGWGARATHTGLTIEFDDPQHWIAADFPGGIAYVLYLQGESIGSESFGFGGSGNFGGLYSDIAFDRVVILDPTGGSVGVDDLHISIPSPGAAALLLGLGACGKRSRRRPA